MRPGRWSRGIRLSAVTDFPEPDPPTMPSVSPGSTWKETPSTAFTEPSSVGKTVSRSLTSSKCCDAVIGVGCTVPPR